MPEEDTGSGTAAPADQAQQATGAPEPVAAAHPQQAASVADPEPRQLEAEQQSAQTPATEQDPAWMARRLDRAKASERERLLKEMGFTSIEEAQDASKRRAAEEEAKKSAEQKALEASQKSEASERRNAELTAALAESVSSDMAKLTEEQREAVVAIAGEDPVAQRRAITALSPTWTTQAPEQTKQEEKKPPPPAKTLQNTAPPPTAPPQNGITSDPDHAAIWADMKKTNPFAAAAYLRQHERAIYAKQNQ